MKFIMAFAAGCAMLAAAQAQAEEARSADPAALQSAREIVNTIMPPDRRNEMIGDVMRAISDQMRSAVTEQFNDAGIRQIVDAYMIKMPDRLRPVTERFMPVLMEAMIQAYARELSAAELGQVAEFARTPAGRHYLSRSSAIMSDPAVAAANRTYFAEAQRVSQASQVELRDAIIDYVSKHPDVSRKMTPDRKAATPSQ